MHIHIIYICICVQLAYTILGNFSLCSVFCFLLIDSRLMLMCMYKAIHVTYIWLYIYLPRDINAHGQTADSISYELL